MGKHNQPHSFFSNNDNVEQQLLLALQQILSIAMGFSLLTQMNGLSNSRKPVSPEQSNTMVIKESEQDKTQDEVIMAIAFTAIAIAVLVGLIKAFQYVKEKCERTDEHLRLLP